jgi:REP element-mobilizing transposase RayT
MGRKTPLVNGEYYHVFNRGVDKRQVFMDTHDQERFIKSLVEFNSIEPTGGLFFNSFKNRQLRSLTSKSGKIVDLVSYCLNPNHFHLILRQVEDQGISKFLQRISTGYTKYFNDRQGRSGALFQGTFKSVHIENNEQLLHVSVYVNLNDRVHGVGKWGLSAKSSWEEYTPGIQGICKKDIILSQFSDENHYKKFAEKAIKDIVKRRKNIDEEGSDIKQILGYRVYTHT